MNNVSGIYEDINESSLEAIEYVSGLYNMQIYEVKKAQHIEKLLLEDYVRTIKSCMTRYDLIDGIFLDAQKQMGNKLKKDRPQFETLKEFIMEDFFNNDKNFKIIRLMQCGYDGYAWCVEFEGYGKILSITFPVRKKLTAKNIKSADYGKFNFSVKKDEFRWESIKHSYLIQDISEAIKDYFDLKVENYQEKNYE